LGVIGYLLLVNRKRRIKQIFYLYTINQRIIKYDNHQISTIARFRVPWFWPLAAGSWPLAIRFGKSCQQPGARSQKPETQKLKFDTRN